MLQQLEIFDYADLPKDQANYILANANEIHERMKRSAEDILAIGSRLIKIKSLLGHGKFGAWLKHEFDWSSDTANRFMAVSRRLEKTQIAEFAIGPSTLYALASNSTPDDVIDRVLERAASGEAIDVQVVQEERQRLKSKTCSSCQHLDRGVDGDRCSARSFTLDLDAEDPGQDCKLHKAGKVIEAEEVPSLEDLLGLYAQIAERVEHKPTLKYRNQFSADRTADPPFSLIFPGRSQAWKWWLKKGSAILERHRLPEKVQMTTPGYPLAGTPAALAGSGNSEVQIEVGDEITGQTSDGFELCGIVEGVGDKYLKIADQPYVLKETAKLSAASPRAQGAKNDGTDEHYTPEHIWQAAKEYLGAIDLDPCSNSHAEPNVDAVNHFTIDDDGLNLPWAERVWCNPPYSDVMPWVDKAIEEIASGRTKAVVFLVKNDNRIAWYQKIMEAAAYVCIYRGYVRFVGANNVAPFASILFILHANPETSSFLRFREHFDPLGWCFPVNWKPPKRSK